MVTACATTCGPRTVVPNQGYKDPCGYLAYPQGVLEKTHETIDLLVKCTWGGTSGDLCRNLSRFVCANKYSDQCRNKVLLFLEKRNSMWQLSHGNLLLCTLDIALVLPNSLTTVRSLMVWCSLLYCLSNHSDVTSNPYHQNSVMLLKLTSLWMNKLNNEVQQQVETERKTCLLFQSPTQQNGQRFLRWWFIQKPHIHIRAYA